MEAQSKFLGFMQPQNTLHMWEWPWGQWRDDVAGSKDH